ncbi:DUF2125 domain-containing protein [Undibacter mobilis]|uniref:DUF2125 domain-containing protein n=1 Tax=Undibacter mobilis TaxID=2292256 RepID=A0A371B7M3_9BRAD|nr:DUF2125 domain-containing protein [Undibacter mobilis]RDV03522.1 DUF2125 domain-containing protein [Undibacter mobilis]
MSLESPSRRSSSRRYIVLIVLVAPLIGGWSAFWYVAAGKAQDMLAGWRAREAKSGRTFTCGTEDLGGFPFRFEFRCSDAVAQIKSSRIPFEMKTKAVTLVSQVYDPTLLIGEYHGPLSVSAPGGPAELTVNWKLFQSSLRGTPTRPERLSLSFERPAVDAVDNGNARPLLRAEHLELHGRLIEGMITQKPVVEVALRTTGAFAPGIRALSAQPVDAVADMVLRGLNDFAPKPWPERFQEIAANGGKVEVTEARVVQGETLAVGSGTLTINANGRLQGQLRLTVAGLEPFLKSIDAQNLVQASPSMDKLANALDRFSPGLGQAAKQQVGANLSAGINMLGQQTTLEGRPAVALPLRVDEGRVYLGPIPVGEMPPLF